MPRSGSTFSFNVAREVALARGSVYQEVTHDVIGTLKKSGGVDYLLLKAHAADDATMALARHRAMRTIITVRDIKESVASGIETFGWSDAEAIEYLRAWIHLYINMREVSLIIPYREIDRRPTYAAWRIARFLHSDVSFFEVMRIARKFSRSKVKEHTDALSVGGEGVTNLGFTYYDDSTYFHRRHVSGLQSRPADQRVPAERINYITAALKIDIAVAGL